jgi:predicted component of type VI protein secretion system
MKKAIRQYAEKLICEYGDAAYQKAQEAARDAHRRRNSRLESFLEKVASEIARRLSGRTITQNSRGAPDLRRFGGLRRN